MFHPIKFNIPTSSRYPNIQVCLARVTTGLNTDLTRISTAFRRFDMDESKHLDETEIM